LETSLTRPRELAKASNSHSDGGGSAFGFGAAAGAEASEHAVELVAAEE
jgi:hypothetical protein